MCERIGHRPLRGRCQKGGAHEENMVQLHPKSFVSYIGNKKSLPTTDEFSWSLDIYYCEHHLYVKTLMILVGMWL